MFSSKSGSASNKSKMKDRKHKSISPSNQVFVRVVFDFEYVAEDGKKVFMKEGEVLLLISKTNQDWWQVRLDIFASFIK